jgi:hypothetical protein
MFWFAPNCLPTQRSCAAHDPSLSFDAAPETSDMILRGFSEAQLDATIDMLRPDAPYGKGL